MTTFDPPELQKRTVDALKALGEIMDIELEGLDADYTPLADCDLVVTADTVIENLSFPRSDLSFELTVGEMLAWADALQTGKLIDRKEYQSADRVLVYVEPANDLAFYATEDISKMLAGLGQTVTIDQQEYRLRMVQGVTLFGLKICQEGGWDKYNPPCNERDVFVEVIHAKGNATTASALVDSYLYELSSTLGLEFRRARYVEVDDDWEDTWSEAMGKASSGGKVRMRPILHGSGIRDLVVLYNEATNVEGVEYAVLGYTKVIEYVAATVVKQHAHQAIRTRLLTAAALKPDAAFIEGLLTLVEDQKTFQKDSEAIKLTIETCCDAPQLAALTPDCVSALKKVTDACKPEEKRDGLRKLAECVSATRNQIVHAKTNFTPKGQECHENQLEQLRVCLRAAAEQTIRWFAEIPDSFRVLKGT